jgi:hypothetical protein
VQLERKTRGGYKLESIGEKVVPLPDLFLLGGCRDVNVRQRGRRVNSKYLQNRFCEVYAKRGDLSGKDCAVEAGYSPVSAANVASRLLKKAEVQRAVAAILESGVPCIVRLPLRVRRSLWANEFLRLRAERYNELRAALGETYREFLDERYNKAQFNRRQRKEGHMTHRLHTRIATEYAMDICNAKYGQLGRRKQKWDKYNQKWVW